MQKKLTPLAAVMAACEARERKDAVIAKAIQFAIALPPDERNVVADGVCVVVEVYEHEGHEYRNIQIETDGDTVVSITWHGHFTDPAYSEHIYHPGSWEAAVLA